MKQKNLYVEPILYSIEFLSRHIVCTSQGGVATTEYFEYETVNTDELF